MSLLQNLVRFANINKNRQKKKKIREAMNEVEVVQVSSLTELRSVFEETRLTAGVILAAKIEKSPVNIL